MRFVPKTLLRFSKKTVILILIVGILVSNFLTPYAVWAALSGDDALAQQEANRTSGGYTVTKDANGNDVYNLSSSFAADGSDEPASAFEVTDKQAKSTISEQKQSPETEEQEAPIGDIVSETLTCSASVVLGSILSSAISAAIQELITAIVGETVGSAVGIGQTVPINTTYDSSNQHQMGDARARSGSYTFFGIFTNVSWDSVAWCIVNAMIEYIANATIAWANSGFNGNPAFLQNPERFFRELADYEAGRIIRDIAYGASGGKVNVCEPFKISVALNLASSYRGSGNAARDFDYRRMSCSLSDISQNNFFGSDNTNIGWSDWNAVTQHDENNPYGATILATDAVHAAASAKENELKFELTLNNGWLNFKKCKDPKDTSTCDTTTPGRLIEAQLNSTLDQSKHRLVMAEKFDQMIAAVVNNLIKVALNKVLEEAQDEE